MSVRDLHILGCSSQCPTRLRNHSAYLLRWNQSGFLFDAGEGTQRQLIYANIAPPTITHILISHFHGDHCLGLGSIFMRLNIDQVKHEVHVYYPAIHQKYFQRLRYGTVYHDNLTVVEHPISEAGIVMQDDKFTIEADFMVHGITCLGYRVTEADTRRFDKAKLAAAGVRGPNVRKLEQEGSILVEGKTVTLDEVSELRKGDSFAYIIDTRPCPQAIALAKGAKMLLCESTYLEEHVHLAHKHYHMTARQAAQLAADAGVGQLVLCHYSARYIDLEPFEKEAREVFAESYAADDLRVFPFLKS